MVFLLLLMVTAAASTAGTATDPLISLSYLEGTFSASLKTDISRTLGDAADSAMRRLDGLLGDYGGYSFAPRFTRISVAAGDTLTLSMGGSIILLSGAATLTTTSGTVINISTGREVATGSQLTQHHRYFCTENTTATITASSAFTGHVDGYYITAAVTASQAHPAFRDILEGTWYYSAIDFVYSNNLFAGTSSNTFSPNTSMTRGMFVTVLYRLEGRPDIGPGGRFTDVQNTSLYYYDAVTWASENNIVAGVTSSTFGPNAQITREQIAVIMHRYARYKQRDISASGSSYDSFPDRSDVSGYAADAMRWAVSQGIISGSSGRLLPRNTATRAQVAQIIRNYVERVG